MRILAATVIAVSMQTLAADGVGPGRWASSDNASMSLAKAGSKFFLDVAVAGDGSFKGTWEMYTCFNYTGPYGIVTAYCQRAKKPQAAAGRLDRTGGTGSINLEGLGKSSFRFKAAANQKGLPQLDIELPRDWLKQGDPVLYETSLNPKK